MNQKSNTQPNCAVNKLKLFGAVLSVIGTLSLSSLGAKAHDKAVAPQISANDTTRNSQIYTKVDVQPQFPGGLEAFGMFLGKNIHYPTDDAKSKTQGRVIVKFVVEQDGQISNITIVSSPTQAMAEESKRVLSLSPVWHPGYQNGHTVRVWYIIPIAFKL